MSTADQPRPGPATPADGGPSDAALIGRCREGDAAAWEAIVRRHGRLVVAAARRQGLDAEAADDVFQEVFIVLLRSLGTLENPQGLVRWLMTTSARIAARQARAARRSAGGASVTEPATDEADGTLEQLAALEDRHRVRLAVDELGERCRTLLMALYGGGRSPAYDQVAAELGIPRGSIGPTRARCLARLLERLEAADGRSDAGGPGDS